jgi:hypothetical protein
MNITDEAHVAASRAAKDAYDRWHATPNRDAYVSGFIAAAAKGAVEAAAPLIAAQAALAERVKIVAEVRQHAERTARTLGSSPAASIAVAAIENEVADRINVLPREDEERKCPGCGHANRWHLSGRCAGDLLCCACTDTP